MINKKQIHAHLLVMLAVCGTASADVNPFEIKKQLAAPVPNITVAPPVASPAAIEELTRQMEEIRKQVKESIKLSDEERELGWLYQLKTIGFTNNTELLKDEDAHCIIKKIDKKPINSSCLRNYLERMRRSSDPGEPGKNKPAGTN